jgi:triphosphoribosyl-dephospho-CoA synthetase
MIIKISRKRRFLIFSKNNQTMAEKITSCNKNSEEKEGKVQLFKSLKNQNLSDTTLADLTISSKTFIKRMK